MVVTYTSRYGKIVKRCPGLPEYWYHGSLIARGRSVCDNPDPRCKPTAADWHFCKSLIEEDEQ